VVVASVCPMLGRDQPRQKPPAGARSAAMNGTAEIVRSGLGSQPAIGKGTLSELSLKQRTIAAIIARPALANSACTAHKGQLASAIPPQAKG